MNKHRILSISICFLLLIGLVQACKSKESVLIQNTTCQFPCWQNIRPGSTTVNEANQILLKLPFFDSKPLATPVIVNETRSYNSWTFQKNIREMGGGIIYHNDLVAYIDFDVINKTKISEMVAYYGNPEFVSAISGQADTQWLEIGWIYPKQGVLIIHFNPNWRMTGSNVDITPSLKVYRVYYFDPNLYEILVEEMLRNGADRLIIEQSTQTWNGYGTYPYTEIK